MKWHPFLALLAGLLLSLPLALLLGGVPRPVPALPEVGPGGRRISPVLTAEQRERLLTYRRDCGSGQPCEPPLGCLTEIRLMRQYCTDSQCSTDAQCPDGHVCRNLTTAGDGPLVRFCIPVGVRQEGEPCFALASTREGACADGLICGGVRQGWCGQPCQMGDAAACPTGFFCADTEPEPVCFPTCEARGCPVGQQCIKHTEGASACAEVYGPSCQQTPCPRGGECAVGYRVERPGKIWLECIERCGEGHPPCGPGLICDAWLCRIPCDPQDPHRCLEGYVCRQHRPDRPYTCQPESKVP